MRNDSVIVSTTIQLFRIYFKPTDEWIRQFNHQLFFSFLNKWINMTGKWNRIDRVQMNPFDIQQEGARFENRRFRQFTLCNCRNLICQLWFNSDDNFVQTQKFIHISRLYFHVYRRMAKKGCGEFEGDDCAARSPSTGRNVKLVSIS